MRLKNSFLKKLSPTKKKVVFNVYWATLGKVVTMSGALFVGILVARYLGPEKYGLMNYIISYVAIFMVISNFGLDNIEIRELSKNQEKKNTLLGTSFRIRIVLAFIVYVLILVTTFFYESDAETRVMILSYSFCVFVQPFNIIRNYFTSIVQNEYIVKSEILRTILGGSIKILLLLYNVELFWFVLASAFDFILVASGYFLAYSKKIGKLSSWSYDFTFAKYLLKESFPLLLSGAAIVVYQKIDHVMINNLIDSEALGYYATANKFLNVFIFIPLIITQTLTPIIIRKKEKNINEYYRDRQKMVNLILWVGIILAIFVSSTSYYLISYSFGSKYSPAISVLQILSLKIVFMTLSFSTGQIIIIEGLQKWAIIRDLIGGVVCISCNLIFIPHFGIIGAAYVSILTLLATNILSCLVIKPYFFLLDIIWKSFILGWKDLWYIKRYLIK
jgi:O-antigen/teichoic acid export membrane protein